MIIYVDIDETICTTPESRDYTLATPIIENVQKINDLYDDWTETTKKQFEEWGVKYHDLKLKKPFYDLFIDDRAINSNIYFEDNNDKGDFKRQ